MNSENPHLRASKLYPPAPQWNPDCVFGRTQLIDKIIEENLRGGISVTVNGIRKIGITTLFRTLAEHELGKRGITAFYVNLAYFNTLAEFQDKVLECLETSLADRSLLKGRKSRSANRNFALLSELVKALQGVAQPPVIFLDNFRREAARLLKEEGVKSLRSLIDKKPPGLVFVTSCGGAFRTREETDYFNISVKERLWFLDDVAVEQMLRLPLERAGVEPFSEEETRWIRSAGGRHPHFLSIACRTVLGLRDGGKSRYHEFSKHFDNNVRKQYHRYWSDLTDGEQGQLVAVASGSRKRPDDFDAESLCTEEEDGWRLFSKDFEQFVLGQARHNERSPTSGLQAEDVAEEFDLTAVIDSGESETVEFKSTLRVNIHTGKPDKRMELSTLKTLAGFLNTIGGTLIVGVADHGALVGIDSDKFPNEDKMSLHLVNIVNSRMGPEAMTMIHSSFHDYATGRVLVIRCPRSPVPVFVKDDDRERFYVRTGPSTTELMPKETLRYIKQRFK